RARVSPDADGALEIRGRTLDDERAAQPFRARTYGRDLRRRPVAEEKGRSGAEVRDAVALDELGLPTRRDRKPSDERLARHARDQRRPVRFRHVIEAAAPGDLGADAIDGRRETRGPHVQ